MKLLSSTVAAIGIKLATKLPNALALEVTVKPKLPLSNNTKANKRPKKAKATIDNLEIAFIPTIEATK